MNTSLEGVYRRHHSQKRGDNFVLLGSERGSFLKRNIGTGKRVLDIGCRDGALTAAYSEGNDVFGIDIDSHALALAKQNVGIETMKVDLNGEWPFEQKSFDVVVAAEVIEHLYHPETVFEKVANVLKDDGLLLGTVPNPYSLVNRYRYLRKQKRGTPLMDPTHINHFPVHELSALLERQFKEVRIEGVGRLGWLAETFPQAFAFDLLFTGRRPR